MGKHNASVTTKGVNICPRITVLLIRVRTLYDVVHVCTCAPCVSVCVYVVVCIYYSIHISILMYDVHCIQYIRMSRIRMSCA